MMRLTQNICIGELGGKIQTQPANLHDMDSATDPIETQEQWTQDPMQDNKDQGELCDGKQTALEMANPSSRELCTRAGNHIPMNMPYIVWR
jgi:hypothetical protein